MTKKVILDAIKFRRLMKQVLSPSNANHELRDMMIKYIPTEIIRQHIKSQSVDQDDTSDNYEINNDEINLNNMNPIYLLDVCKAMNDKIQSLEIELQSKDINDMEYKYKSDTLHQRNSPRIQLNVTNMSFMEADHVIVSSYDTNTNDSTQSEYNPVQSNEIDNMHDMDNMHDIEIMEKPNLQTCQSYHVYKNDSGTEVSFDALSSLDCTPNDLVLNDKDVEVMMAPSEEITEINNKEKIEESQMMQQDIVKARLGALGSMNDLIECDASTQTIVAMSNSEAQTTTPIHADIETSPPIVDTQCSIFRIVNLYFLYSCLNHDAKMSSFRFVVKYSSNVAHKDGDESEIVLCV